MEVYPEMGTSRVVQRPLTIAVRPEGGRGLSARRVSCPTSGLPLAKTYGKEKIEGIQRLFENTHEITFTSEEYKEEFIAKCTPLKMV